MINDQRGCDRCGNMFDPDMVDDLKVFHKGELISEHQVCKNCTHLLTMTFRFTEARKVMDVQTSRLADKRTMGQADKQ